MPITASGLDLSTRKAAKPQAGAVLRATGFLHNLRGGHALQLVRDLVGQILVGDDPGLIQSGQRIEPLDSLLNHGALAIERQNLLGAGAARTGPEAGTTASSKYHRSEIDWLDIEETSYSTCTRFAQ